MKTIGKIAALAMTLSLACVLSACGGSASSSAAASSASASASSAATSTSTASSSTSASTSASSTSASTSAAASSASTQGTAYTNDAFGLSYTLPEGWSFVDLAQLNQMNTPLTSTASSDTIEMIASSADGTTAVIVALVPPSTENGGKTAADVLKSQTDQLQSALQGSNFEFTSKDADITFEGLTRTLPANVITINAAGQTACMAQAVAEKDGYFLEILISGLSEDSVTGAFNSFKAATA